MSPSNLNSQLLGRSLLNGRSLTIGTLPLRPYTSYTNVSFDGRINDMDGFVHQIVLYLAFKYQFTFEYFLSPDSAYGAISNGSWIGLVGMLQREEIDLIAATLTVNYERSQAIGLTVPFDDDDLTFIMPYPELDTMGTVDGITKPFQSEVWLCIGISVLCVAFVLWKILSLELFIFNKRTITNRSIAEKISFISSFWSLFGLHTIINARAPIRPLLIAWSLATIVLVNAYSSVLTSYLMTSRYHLMAESVEDIANISRPVFMVSKYSANAAVVLNANSGALSNIGDSLRKYPELTLNSKTSHKVAPELIVKYHKTFASGKAVLLAMMEEDLKDTGQCRLYLAKKPWGVTQSAFGLPKFSPAISIFNHEINWVRQVGLLDYWHRLFWPKPNQCSEPLKTKIKNETKLSLSHVSSAFLLLGSGLAASLLVFLLEIIVAKAQHRRHQ